MTTALQQLEQRLQQALSVNIVGLEAAVRALTIAIVARGHVLVQGVPGLGKTLLSKTLAAALGGDFKRIQGTADLMPTDIIGVHVFDSARSEFVFRPGPLFADVVLFDEINRAGTEDPVGAARGHGGAAGERSIAQQCDLPADFLVMATQNPREFEGTYPLPESQLDRFMLRIDLDYPARASEAEVLERYAGVATGLTPPGGHRGGGTAGALAAARECADASPRGAGAARLRARSRAGDPRAPAGDRSGCRPAAHWRCCVRRASPLAMRGAEFVSPDDVKAVLPLVVAHRLVLSSEALLEGSSEAQVLQRLSEQVAVPR